MSCSVASAAPLVQTDPVLAIAQETVSVVNSSVETVEAPPAEVAAVEVAPIEVIQAPVLPASDFVLSQVAEPAGLALQIVSVTSPVKAGESATLKAHSSPGAHCTINVYYNSTRSTSEGLADRTVEASGNITWMWKVGADIAPGSYKIEVLSALAGKSVSQTTNITVSPKESAVAPPTTKDAGPALVIQSVISPVKSGESATLKIQTVAGAECKISVYYNAGKSAAEGLITKKAEASGNVTWTWKTGTDLAAGTYRIEVTASLGGKTTSQTTSFTVTK
jgi:flagellar hook assembly protein FlgD